MSKPAKGIPSWMNPKKLPSQEELNALFSYDPATGKIMSRAEAGSINRLGYRTITFGKKRFLAHRLAWKLAYGVEPRMIDHINGNASDNRLCNLREVTQHQNQMNQPERKGRTLPRGVIRVGVGKPFRANITIKGKNHYLGSFNTSEEASAVYQKRAAIEFGEFRRNAL